jgi:hypothetical protein
VSADEVPPDNDVCHLLLPALLVVLPQLEAVKLTGLLPTPKLLAPCRSAAALPRTVKLSVEHRALPVSGDGSTPHSTYSE